jgi:GT2 family glycosyltransferase
MHWLDHGMQFDYPSIEGTEAGWGRFYTTNVSVKRGLLERVGGFDEGFPFGYEDLDLAKRMHEHGFRLLYNRRARVEHLHPTTLEEWRQRMVQVARAERRFVAKHPDVRPYFHHMLIEASRRPAAQGRRARLVKIVPRSTPWLGERVWSSADIWYRQQLAPSFLAAWSEAAADQALMSSEGSG